MYFPLNGEDTVWMKKCDQGGIVKEKNEFTTSKSNMQKSGASVVYLARITYEILSFVWGDRRFTLSISQSIKRTFALTAQIGLKLIRFRLDAAFSVWFLKASFFLQDLRCAFVFFAFGNCFLKFFLDWFYWKSIFFIAVRPTIICSILIFTFIL